MALTRGRRRGLVLAAIAVAVVVIGTVWWGVRSSDTRADAGSNLDTGFTAFPPDQRRPLPDVSGPTITGDTLSLSDFRGKVLVLNVWGSWCVPCRAEAPDLASGSTATYDQGVRFVGIDVRDNPAAARAFERTYAITYPSFDDSSGKVLAQFTGVIPISAVPSTIFVDTEGRIAARNIGRIDRGTLRGEIENLLAEARGSRDDNQSGDKPGTGNARDSS